MADNKKKVLKVIVPVLIVIVIVGMWFVKNGFPKGEVAEERKPSEQVKETSEETKNTDFSLNAETQIDFAALAEHGIPVIADYGSDDCIPCKQMKPVLEKMNEEFEGKAFVKFVDVWKYQEAAGNVPIQVIPTQILFNADGSPFTPSEELQKEIEFMMYSDKEGGDHAFTAHQGGLTEEQFRKILKEMGVE